MRRTAIRACAGGDRSRPRRCWRASGTSRRFRDDWREWHVNAANPGALARTLALERERALLFRTLATLRTDMPLFDDVDALRWRGDS